MDRRSDSQKPEYLQSADLIANEMNATGRELLDLIRRTALSPNYPTAECFLPQEVWEYEHTGLMPNGRLAHQDSCVNCQALLVALQPNVGLTAEFIEKVHQFRSSSHVGVSSPREDEEEDEREIAYVAVAGAPNLGSHGRGWAVAFAAVAAVLCVGVLSFTYSKRVFPKPTNSAGIAEPQESHVRGPSAPAPVQIAASHTTPPQRRTAPALSGNLARTNGSARSGGARVQAGAQAVQAPDQKTLAANQSAASAQQMADAANDRVGLLTNTVANLDNYRPVAETSVKFGFDQDNLTPKAKEALDQLAGTIASTKGYIIALESGTDSVGSAEYNYDLSQRRADSVIQYLASKYNVPAHKIYVIGLGKDKPVETNKTADGRAENRIVNVSLMTNTKDYEGEHKPD